MFFSYNSKNKALANFLFPSTAKELAPSKYILVDDKIALSINVWKSSYDFLNEFSNAKEEHEKISKSIEDITYFPTLYRIRALRDIPRHGVKAGDFGGYVSHKDILSQEGDSWIGEESAVISIITGDENEDTSEGWSPRLSIRDNAIVKGGTTVISIRPYSYHPSNKAKEINSIIEKDAVIDGGNMIYASNVDYTFRISGTVSGSNLITNPRNIEGTITGDNLIFDSLTLDKDAIIDGKNLIGESCFIREFSKVLGNVMLGKANTLNRGAVIQGNATVGNGNYFSDRTNISGNASIGQGCKMTKEAIVRGNAQVGDKVRILGDITVTDNVIIEDKVVLEGLATIKGDMVVPTPQKLVVSSLDGISVPFDMNAKVNTQDQTSHRASSQNQALEASKVPESILKKHERILKEIASYESDIVKLLKYPVFTDPTNEITLEMMIALNDVNDISPESSPEEYIDAVKALDKAFLKAEANARRICATSLDENQVKKVTTAKTLFAMVVDEASSETEKKNAFKQGMKALEGIVAVPDKAVDSLRQRSGLLELEA